MADKRSEDRKNNRVPTGRRIDMDQPVNQTITLPNAEKPAKPPKGKSRGTTNAPSAEQETQG